MVCLIVRMRPSQLIFYDDSSDGHNGDGGLQATSDGDFDNGSND